VIDEHGKVRSANPAAERMLGQDAADLVGAHFFDLMATTTHQPPIHSLSRMAYADCPVQIELTRPDGSTLIADVSVNQIPDHPGATFVAQLHDVTEMKRREAELRLARDEAEAASNSKSQFLANMSHELRTPLNAVIGFSEIMKAELLGPIGTESYRGYSSSIHDSARHLLSIINDILDISSIESGTPKLYEDVHEPAQLCQSVVALVQGRADAAQIGLKIMVDPQIDLLYADGRMVKQMMINLVGNAIKFSPKGGRIEIKVAPTGDSQGGMIFSVVDHGIGIAKADIPRILKPFEQVETAFARNFDGIGLGLPLVNSMARLHGAIFTIDSELNHGTVASILFPPARVKPRPAETVVAQPATHVHLASMTAGNDTGKRRIRAAE
jgi:PAS domain S-box-containing protein